MTHNTDDAADVSQETWLTAMEKLSQLHSPEAFPGWLLITARRHALRLVRTRDRCQLTDPEMFDLRLDPTDGAEISVERRETVDLVRRAVFQLAPERAYLLVELVCKERSYKDLAAELGRPVGSLGPTRARYLKQLAQVVGTL